MSGTSPPTVTENLVGSLGETAGFREMCLPASFLAVVRHARFYGRADAMKEVLCICQSELCAWWHQSDEIIWEDSI
jgi:hypothetical protein